MVYYRHFPFASKCQGMTYSSWTYNICFFFFFFQKRQFLLKNTFWMEHLLHKIDEMTSYLLESWGQWSFIPCQSLYYLLQKPSINTSAHRELYITPNSKFFQKIHVPLKFSMPWTIHQYSDLTLYPVQVFVLHFRFSTYTLTQETNATQSLEPWQFQLK